MMTTNQNDSAAEQPVLRQRWISACARTAPMTLSTLHERLKPDLTFEPLRPAEAGLVMVRARAGGTGQLFNAGEMTVSRCSLRGSNGVVGHGYVAGRDKRHAEAVAKLDVVFQSMDEAECEPIVAELEMAIRAGERVRQQKSAPTRVEFFTMVRGEDE